MLGRADSKKRFHIGMKAMEYMVNEIPEYKILIILDLNGMGKLINLINNINILNNIIFIGYNIIK